MLSFENALDGTVHTCYYLPKVGIKNYKTDGKNFFDQPVES